MHQWEQRKLSLGRAGAHPKISPAPFSKLTLWVWHKKTRRKKGFLQKKMWEHLLFSGTTTRDIQPSFLQTCPTLSCRGRSCLQHTADNRSAPPKTFQGLGVLEFGKISSPPRKKICWSFSLKQRYGVVYKNLCSKKNKSDDDPPKSYHLPKEMWKSKG